MITRSAPRTIRRSTPWMCDCGCFSTQPWWRPYSVAWTVTSHGTCQRRASLRAAAATSQSCEWTRSKPPPSSSPAARMSSFMWSTQAMNASTSPRGKSGSRTRWTITPWRVLLASSCPPPRVRTWTSTPSRDELLGELAHVPREAALDDRRVLPAEDQDARRAHGGAGHYPAGPAGRVIRFHASRAAGTADRRPGVRRRGDRLRARRARGRQRAGLDVGEERDDHARVEVGERARARRSGRSAGARCRGRRTKRLAQRVRRGRVVGPADHERRRRAGGWRNGPW